MWSGSHKPAALAVLFSFLVASAFAQQSKHIKHEKNIWNYEGGVFFETDGSLPNGVCFRVSGHMSAGDFFNGLKRIDTEQGAVFRRGNETVTQFPDSVTVTFSIRDESCATGMQPVGASLYLTQKMLDDLRLSLYWKHGVDLRPAKNVKELGARVDRIQPYATALAAELPRRYEWSYQLSVPSAGVPLSDGLAFVFRAANGRIAARVGARM